jgi:hypothetical protein
MRRTSAGLIVVFAVAALARADIDVETAPVIKAKSTLTPEGESETYRFPATAGSALKFSLSAARRGSLHFVPVLTDPNGQTIPLGPLVVKPTPKGVSAPLIPLGVTGQYRLDVYATGTGDYSLALTAAPQTHSFGAMTLATSEMLPFTFSAPPGSTLALTAKAAKGSTATPRFGLLESGTFSQDLAAAGRATATSHTVSVVSVGGNGDFSVPVSNTGPSGSLNVSVVIRPPKTKPSKLDLRGVVHGRPAGGETLMTRAIGSAGGTVTVADATSDLDGATVVVPAGALTASLPITIASAAVPPLGDDSKQAAGPAVDLEPSGTVFSQSVTVTLPFDFSLLPADAVPADIQVLVREKDGSSATFPVSSVDEVNGTVTVQTNGFSTCIPVVTAGIVRLGVASNGGLKPGGDEFWTLSLHDDMADDPAANDSRGRGYEVSVGEVSFHGDGTLELSDEQRRVEVDEQGTGPGGGIVGTVQATVQSQQGAGTWTYDADGRSIDVTDGGSNPPVLAVSRGGDVMIGKARGAADRKTELIVLLRKNTATLTAASLSGTWHLVAAEVDATSESQGPVDLRAAHVSGRIAFDGKGGFRLTGGQRQSRFQDGAADWESQLKTLAINGTYSVEAAGTVLLTLPPDKPGDTGNVLRAYPGPGATAMLCTDKDARADGVFAMALVKQASGLSLKSLSGEYVSSGIEVNTQIYSNGSVSAQIGDLELRDEDISVTFAGAASIQLSTQEHGVIRDTSTPGGVSVTNPTGSFQGTVSVTSAGDYKVTTADGGVVGCVSPDVNFGFFVNDLGDTRGDHLFEAFVRPAPKK